MVNLQLKFMTGQAQLENEAVACSKTTFPPTWGIYFKSK
jgi:hypothetical protein